MDYGNGGFFNLNLSEYTIEALTTGVTIKGLYETAMRAADLGKFCVLTMPKANDSGYWGGIPCPINVFPSDTDGVVVFNCTVSDVSFVVVVTDADVVTYEAS